MSKPIFHILDRPLETGVLEGRQPPAALADSVMVVLAPGNHRLEPCAALSHLDSLHETLTVEEIEGAIDARDAHMLAPSPDPIGDLLGAEAAVMLTEKVDDRPARSSGPAPIARQRPRCELCPRCI